ncbi:MAG TPA: hypothetical protein VGR47_02050 [Terracidiphilus sp.]|nr:hypothetical protein [Terracidiphilus sp.]
MSPVCPVNADAGREFHAISLVSLKLDHMLDRIPQDAEPERKKMNTNFQQTATCQDSNCLTTRVHPKTCQGVRRKQFCNPFSWSNLEEAPFCRLIPQGAYSGNIMREQSHSKRHSRSTRPICPVASSRAEEHGLCDRAEFARLRTATKSPFILSFNFLAGNPENPEEWSQSGSFDF